PAEPSAEEIDSLKKLLSEAFKKDVILSTKIDPNVLGGMKLEFGQYIIDGTVTANLEKLKYHIIS
ncbi:MAG: F0F1 ATP synthase subunit delta, partial [Patescibacteria group bacterium]